MFIYPIIILPILYIIIKGGFKMKELLGRIKEKIIGDSGYDIPDEFGEDYLEIEPENIAKNKAKVLIKPYLIKEFSDINVPLNDLREGRTIALINVKHLKNKDMVELKRTISKLKKTCSAIDGDIAGFGDDWLVATPSFAQVFRPTEEKKEE